MEAVHQGLPIAYNISLASLKSSRPGQNQGPPAMKATCVDPKGECFLAQAAWIWFLFPQARQTVSRWVPHWIRCK
jgi:hypothetical protein